MYQESLENVWLHFADDFYVEAFIFQKDFAPDYTAKMGSTKINKHHSTWLGNCSPDCSLNLTGNCLVMWGRYNNRPKTAEKLAAI